MTVLLVDNVSIGLSERVNSSSGLQADGTRWLLNGISFSVEAGEVVTIMGPSGSGKSTLLSYIVGTLGWPFLAEGNIRLDGVDVSRLAPQARKIGILFQDDLLFPHLSVGQNLAFGLAARIKGPERRAMVLNALDQAQLTGFYDRDPATLSGGQKLRASLMRALLAEPQALLLDEPFAKLDPDLRRDFRAFVFGHAVERKLPIVMVTHDAEDAAATNGQIIRLQG